MQSLGRDLDADTLREKAKRILDRVGVEADSYFAIDPMVREDKGSTCMVTFQTMLASLEKVHFVAKNRFGSSM